MRRGFWTVVMACLATAWPAGATAGETGWSEVTVRVYDNAHVSDAVVRHALEVAAHALAPGTIDVSWLRCRASSGGRCMSSLERTELVVRLSRSHTFSRSASADRLGDAFIDATTGTGVVATIYVERVEALAHAARADVGVLLGRAIAHELGHLLIGGLHGARGLMRPSWTLDEVRRNGSADWGFALPELMAMRARTRPAPSTRRPSPPG